MGRSPGKLSVGAAGKRIIRRATTMVSPCAFGRVDFDGFVRRVWQGTNTGAEARQAA